MLALLERDKLVKNGEPQAELGASHFEMRLAANRDEIEEAQRLRYQVFFEEMGARAPSKRSLLDVDEYDADCEHLIVRELQTKHLVGNYRTIRHEIAVWRVRAYVD